MRPLDALQLRIGHQIRLRVAGADADARARRIWAAPGPRWVDRRQPLAVVHADATMFVGGITALLLQSLHPLAMAGVAGHSGYKSDPWGRVQRTSGFIAMTTFGPIPDAEAAIAQVRAVHERVRGKDFRGRTYRASDPDLLRWVHVAEAWSFLTTQRLYSDHPVSDIDADIYVDQAAHVAALLGATEVPRSASALEATLEGYRPQLEVTPAALEACEFLLTEPPLTGTARFGYRLLAAGGIAALPPWAREMLHLPVSGVRHRAQREVGHLGVRATAWALDAVRDDRLFGADSRPTAAAGSPDH